MKKKHTLYEPCHFIPFSQTKKAKPPKGSLWFDVSSYGSEPYDTFSPFYVHGNIPVPGMSGVYSDSVEGIWQGLKVIRGQIAQRYFNGWGKKRGGKPSGHQYGEQKRLLKIVEARQKIYIPAYCWMLENKISPKLISEIIERCFQNIPQFFYDVEDNASIGKDLPLSHAAVLVTWLNEQCEKSLTLNNKF